MGVAASRCGDSAASVSVNGDPGPLGSTSGPTKAGLVSSTTIGSPPVRADPVRQNGVGMKFRVRSGARCLVDTLRFGSLMSCGSADS